MGKLALALLLAIGLLFCSCSMTGTESAEERESGPRLTDVSDFGEVEGKQVRLYALVNDNGMRVKIINYGGIVQSLEVPDSEGNVEDVVLGFNSLQKYGKNPPISGLSSAATQTASPAESSRWMERPTNHPSTMKLMG